MKMKIVCLASLLVIVVIGGWNHVGATSPRFYPDDPIVREPEPQDASTAAFSEINMMYELTYNSFAVPKRKPVGLRAQNLNTADEVPDSSWFTNRVGSRSMSIDDLVRGPNVGAPPDPSKWVIVRQKSAGGKPGVTAQDANGETWFLEFDPPYYPEAATAAVVMATKFFHAFGYNVVESYLTTFDPRRMEIAPDAMFKRPNGKRTVATRRDIDELLERGARNPDGTYRVIAGRLIPGKIIGRFRYEGTRPDDPNDLVPHENRRELRGLYVFGAWTNMTDFKAANTMDTLITENGRTLVKHYLQDVGSTFGVANDIHQHDLGWEHFIEIGPAVKRMATFGFAFGPWATVKYEASGPSLGKFEGDRFDPRTWRTHTLNPATVELRPDDAFWAARRIAAFDERMIRAIIHTGEFSDPAAEKVLGDVMLKRRTKILQAYLPAVNPVVDPIIKNNRLSFHNAAVDADVAKAPAFYRAAWSQFDNTTGATRALGVTSGLTPAMDAPDTLPTTPGSYILVEISAESQEHPAWREPIHAYFRAEREGWKLVGLERLPETMTANLAQPVSTSERLR